MAKLKGSTVLIVLGVALIVIGAAYPLVTLVVDTTPPNIDGTQPTWNQTFASLDKLICAADDPESGIKVVYGWITGMNTWAMLTHHSDEPADVYSYTLPTPLTTPGTYQFNFSVANNAGLWSSKAGSFRIYTQLQGKWYINNQEITSSSQTVYSTSTTVSFKFQKTAGIDDSYISCWVEEGGTKILTLSLTDSTNHIWTGSYTFTAGTHNLAIKAYDGTATITYSIVGLTIPGAVEWVMTTQQTLILAGVMVLVAGVVMRAKKY